MRPVSFVRNILTSYHRKQEKSRVLEELLYQKQESKGVVNIYRKDKTNVGDCYSAPHHYFPELHHSLDISGFKSQNKEQTNQWISGIAQNSLIIGGGGLLNRKSFSSGLRTMEILSHKKKMVIWGAGHNSKNKKDFKKLSAYNIDLEKFGLAGTRDYRLAKEWVPCVSCLHPVFDKEYTSTQETGIIFHKKTMKNQWITSSFKEYPIHSNTTNLDSLVNFIGSSETLITDSYHAMYWAMLLNKKVVVVPNSSKFFDFKYQPVFSTFANSLKDAKKAEQTTGILKECREKNLKFATKVFNYLEI